MLKDILKSLRENKKLTKKQIAEAIGVTERAYITYEYGERDVSTDTLTKLADFYGVTTDYLLGRPEAKEPPDPIDQLMAKFDMSLLEKKILEEYLKLDEKMRGDFMEFLHKAVVEVQAASLPNGSTSPENAAEKQQEKNPPNSIAADMRETMRLAEQLPKWKTTEKK